MDTMHARLGERPDAHDQRREQAPVAPARNAEPSPLKQKKRARLPRWAWLVAAIICLAAIVIVGMRLFAGPADGIDHGKYQAIFLANSSSGVAVYFGKLERLPDGYYKLTNVYFLPSDQTADKIQKDNTLKLTKMTTQIHSPDDSMVLPREQIMYYQNMQDSSKIVQYIKQDSQKN